MKNYPLLNKPTLLFLILSTGFIWNSCVEKSYPHKNFTFAAWTGGGIAENEAQWREKFELFSNSGLTDLYVGAGREKLEEIAVYAADYNINIHAWMWVMNRPGDTTAAKHPDWYAVNRNGDNSYDYRAYVDYG